MGFLDKLKEWFSPPRISDPKFGDLLFMENRFAPEKSYWECEREFPPTGTVIFNALPGDESGPFEESRAFHIDKEERFSEILIQVRPKLEPVFKDWLEMDLPDDIFSELKLAGIGLEAPRKDPVIWDVSFETTGERWLGIVIPFSGDTPNDAVVDT